MICSRTSLVVIGIFIVSLVGVVAVTRFGSNTQDTLIIQQKEAISSDTKQTSPECPKNFTPAQTEGPYYNVGSPKRTNIRAANIPGEPIIVTGFMFNKNCQPIANVWLDFWQADGEGEYDNQGYNLRGHQFTDANGRYRLETVMPAQYANRTPHIHVKVRAKEESQVLTTQLYFPGEVKNSTDSIFNSALIVSMSEESGIKTATFHFKLSEK